MSAAALAAPRLSPTARLVMRGLVRPPYSLPSWFVREGAAPELLDEVTRHRERVVAARERLLLAGCAPALAQALAGAASVVELGADGTDRLGPLLTALLTTRAGLVYAPVGAREQALTASVLAHAGRTPRLEVLPRPLDFVRSAAFLADLPQPRVVVLPVGRLGSFELAAAAAWLRLLRTMSSPLDTVLLGLDQRDDGAALAAELDDAAGLSARLDRGALERLAHELGADFDTAQWAHAARWNAAEQRTETHLVARSRQPVFVDRLGLPLLFARGDSIHTESRQQHPDAVVSRLLFAGGLVVDERWQDDARGVALVLARWQ